MRAPVRFGVVSLLVSFAALVGTGCEEDAKNEQPKLAQIAESCGQAEPCAGGLTCAFASCHAECVTTKDCRALGGGLCVANAEAGRICQLPAEKSCVRSSDCAGTQVCGVDGRCRDACAKDTDCGGGQVCRDAACADAEEQGGGGGAGGASPVACLTPKDCKDDEICELSICKPR